MAGGRAVDVERGRLFHTLEYRRSPVLLERTGSPDFVTLQSGGISGPYLADQALHATVLLGSAVLLTRL
ncbi:hypothetical protein [Kitasatospora sp. NPDC058218]|uniref:hypothetical protein n=1 Tax=Kitasatospora sp. NPDC058218 TaxID=3346385 RepID=UPI0036DD002F